MLHDLVITNANEFTGAYHAQITFRIDGDAAERIIKLAPDHKLYEKLKALGDTEETMSWEYTDGTGFHFLIDGVGTNVEHWADGLHFSMLVPVEHEDAGLDGTATEFPLSDTFWVQPSRIIRAFLAA